MLAQKEQHSIHRETTLSFSTASGLLRSSWGESKVPPSTSSRSLPGSCHFPWRGSRRDRASSVASTPPREQGDRGGWGVVTASSHRYWSNSERREITGEEIILPAPSAAPEAGAACSSVQVMTQLLHNPSATRGRWHRAALHGRRGQ